MSVCIQFFPRFLADWFSAYGTEYLENDNAHILSELASFSELYFPNKLCKSMSAISITVVNTAGVNINSATGEAAARPRGSQGQLEES